MPKGKAIITDPEKAIYNKVYNKTSFNIFGFLSSFFK